MVSINEVRKGMTIEVEGGIWTVVDYLHVKPGKGAAFVRTTLKNVKTGQSQERTFRGGEKVARAHIETREMQYLYHSGSEYFFMDAQSFEQQTLPAEVLGDAPHFLVDNMNVLVQFYEGKPIGLELPTAVELEVVDTEPGFKGDTATGATKPATLSTGHVVQVPLFVERGTKIRVDTRSGEYLSRV